MSLYVLDVLFNLQLIDTSKQANLKLYYVVRRKVSSRFSCILSCSRLQLKYFYPPTSACIYTINSGSHLQKYRKDSVVISTDQGRPLVAVTCNSSACFLYLWCCRSIRKLTSKVIYLALRKIVCCCCTTIN